MKKLYGRREGKRAGVEKTSRERRACLVLVELFLLVMLPEVPSSEWLDKGQSVEHRLVVWWGPGWYVYAVAGVAFLAVRRRGQSVPAKRAWALCVHCTRNGQHQITNNGVKGNSLDNHDMKIRRRRSCLAEWCGRLVYMEKDFVW